mmetsp:Transcript_104821/g.208319  ORF Transcript_104821/g.208319 Transcript_104821/m.208319 type:complete len:91 (+) Transcript_104821:1451-1723(+)
MGVPVGGQNFAHTVTHLQNRDVKCATAKVEDNDGFIVFLFQPVGKRSSCWLVHYAQNLQACDLACIFRGLSLRIVEVSRYCDDCFVDLCT